MSTLTGPDGVVIDGWRPRLIDAIRVALHAALPWATVSDSDVTRLVGCSRMAFDRSDPGPDVWTRWLATAAQQGVEFTVEPRVTANGTSWKATARMVPR